MSQIEFFLSGGLNNSDPNKSIGGAKSNLPIIGELNNLFPNITSEEAQSGKTDYRCFYVMNTGSQTLYDASVYLSNQNPLGASVMIGASFKSEVQRIKINNNITSGSIIFNFNSELFTVNWPGNAQLFGEAIKSGLESRSSVGAGNVSVLYTVPANFSSAYKITFEQDSSNVSWPLIKVATNSLSGGGTLTINVQTVKVISGSPKNSNPDTLPTDSMPPNGVSFGVTSPTSRISIGDLAPGDFAPIWAMRATPPETEYLDLDYFSVRVVGSPF